MTEETADLTIRIEVQSAVPYEQSLLWSQHQSYYQEQGLAAFLRQEVPYNISSNPCLAGQALRLLLASQHQDAPGPIHVLEIGAGLGIFAYNFLRALEDQAPELELCYWLSDYSLAGLQELAAQPVFAKWRASGRLKLCLIDGQDPRNASDLDGQPLDLPEAGFALLLANYFFSTLPTAVLLRQRDQWLRQLTRVEWLPLGESPTDAELNAFGDMIAIQLRSYRLLDHIESGQPGYALFAALQQAQEQVAAELSLLAGILPAGADFADWLAERLTLTWAKELAVEANQELRRNVEQILVAPLFQRASYPPGQLHEEHNFAPADARELFGSDLDRQAIENLTSG